MEKQGLFKESYQAAVSTIEKKLKKMDRETGPTLTS